MCSGIEEQRFLPENLPKNILHEKQYNTYSGNLQVDKNSNVFPSSCYFLTSFKTEFSKHPVPRIQGTRYCSGQMFRTGQACPMKRNRNRSLKTYPGSVYLFLRKSRQPAKTLKISDEAIIIVCSVCLWIYR